MTPEGWIKCRFCTWAVPRITRKSDTSKDGNYHLSNHVVDRHWDKLTDEERDCLLPGWRTRGQQ